MTVRTHPLTPRLLLAVGLFAVALMGGVAAQETGEADEKQIAKLIEQLGDDDYTVRKAAEKKLNEFGEPAMAQIKKAARDAVDVDVKLRAIVLSATMSKRLYGQLRTFAGHTREVRHLAVSKDGKRILSGSEDHSARLWDTDTGKEIREFTGHKSWVWSVAFSPDETQILTAGGMDPTMRLWNVADGKEVRPFTGNTSRVYGAAFSPDGKHVASGGAGTDCSIRIYETNGEEVHKLEGHKGWVWKIAYSPDGKKLASAGTQDKSFRIWDAKTGKALIEGQDAHDGNVVGVAFSPDGKTLLTSGRDVSVKLWDVEKGTLIRKYLGAGDNVEAIAFSKDGKRFLAGETKIVHVFDTASGKIVHRFENHTDEVLAVAFLPDGRSAVSAGKDMIIRLWGIPK